MTIDYNRLRQLRSIINNIHHMRQRAKLFKVLDQARKEFDPGGKTLVGNYDFSVWIEKILNTPLAAQETPLPPRPVPARPVPPRPVTVRPVTVRRSALIQLQPVKFDPELLGYILKEIYDSGYDFGDCKNPGMLREFIHPNDSSKWYMRAEDLTGPQRRTLNLIMMRYKAWRAAQGYIPGYMMRRVPLETS